MSSDASSAAPAGAASDRTLVLSAMLLTLLGLRLHLMLRLNLNWDEFHYLSFVYDFLRGSPLAWRQTFHVHLFSWLAAIPGDEVRQLLAARLALFCLGLASSGLIYLIGRRLLSTSGALFAVLCYNALAEVLAHGASFRPDPLATFLALAAAAALLARPTGRAAAIGAATGAGLALALSFMLTLKTVFFLPGAAVLALIEPPGGQAWQRRLRRLLALAVAAVVGLAVLWTLHRQAIVAPSSDGSQIADVQRIAGNILWPGYWFPGRHYLLRSLGQSALVWVLLTGGLLQAILDLRSRRSMLPLLVLALPLATVVFYRNSFPYFLACILAPAVLLCGLALDRLRRLADRSGRLGPVLATAILIGVFATGVANYVRQLPNGLAGQRLLIATIHRMFPEPVPYIDRCSMIASFPKVGFFMSTWGMERYARERRPVLAEAVRDHAPPFLLANTLPLNLLLPDSEAARLRYRLLREDRRTLQRHYIHHWGIIFVAGKRLRLAAGDTELEILIPGAYTLEGELAVAIDGRPVEPGAVIELAAGRHVVTAATAGPLTLRWGDNLYRPTTPPPRKAIFVGL
jgi:hypothetical protein